MSLRLAFKRLALISGTCFIKSPDPPLSKTEIGIADLDQPDFGDPVSLYPTEIPVFWACGVTSQLAATSASLSRVITHAPGYMFVSDLKDEDLTIL